MVVGNEHWTAIGVIGAAGMAMVGTAVAAYFSYLSHRQTKSPNGVSVGTMTYEQWKRQQDMAERQVEMKEHMLESRERQMEMRAEMAALRECQDEHLRLDDERFSEMFRRLDDDQ